jgi:hypothetical protein
MADEYDIILNVPAITCTGFINFNTTTLTSASAFINLSTTAPWHYQEDRDGNL